MKRIKAINGYTIYQMTARDEKQGNGIEGEYAIYFSSDVRDYGVTYSTPEYDGIETLEIAESLISDTESIAYAQTKEALEEQYTAVTFEDIVEAMAEQTTTNEEEDTTMMTQAQDNRSDAQRHVDSIVETLTAVYNGEYYGDDYDTEEGDEEREPLTMWDYFDGDGIYDINYVIDANREYKAVRIMVACGGPNIYINTWDRCVELYWWGNDAKAWLPSEICDAIDEVFEEFFNC